jgi:hypothetical protein
VRGPALAVVAAFLSSTSLAAAADRGDPVPASVGPPGGVAFYVDATNVPAAVDKARWLALVQRTLARWGDTYLGTTTLRAGNADGANVVGFGTLPADVLGVARTWARTSLKPVFPRLADCIDVADGTTAYAARGTRTVTLRLRADRVAGGRVVRRTRSVRVERPTSRIATRPLERRDCVAWAATSADEVTGESDVVVQTDASWQAGPTPPTAEQWDLETNLLHELGHVSGLEHVHDRCDPGTPMGVSQGNGDWWHAVDDVFRPSCGTLARATPLTAADATDALPGAAGAALAGQTLYADVAGVPAGYDPARFAAVVARAVARAGGSYGGVADRRAVSGDGVSVVGFRRLQGFVYKAQTVAGQHHRSAYTRDSCAAAILPFEGRAVRKRTIRRRAGGRTLRLRRDVLRSTTLRLPGHRCTTRAFQDELGAPARELDVQLQSLSLAWELGPALPVDGSRYDLETAVLSAFAATGADPAAERCSVATPAAPGFVAGDWWRSAAQVRRAGCQTSGARAARTTRTAHETSVAMPPITPDVLVRVP